MSRDPGSYFFLPPFLPLDMRLFLPTAMVADPRASGKGGRRDATAREAPAEPSPKPSPKPLLYILYMYETLYM